MTEEEAKSKICCASSGREYGLRCKASECMAWRVIDTGALQFVYNKHDRPEGEGWKPMYDGPENMAWQRNNPNRWDGYCGLAGTP